MRIRAMEALRGRIHIPKDDVEIVGERGVCGKRRMSVEDERSRKKGKDTAGVRGG